MSVAQKTDTRKTRLTLEQINRLRMLSDVKITEYAKELTNIKKQYSVPVAAEQITIIIRKLGLRRQHVRPLRNKMGGFFLTFNKNSNYSLYSKFFELKTGHITLKFL